MPFDQIRPGQFIALRDGTWHVVQGADARGPFKYGGYFGRRYFTREETIGAFQFHADAERAALHGAN